MCARNGFIQAHGFGGRPGGRFQTVKGAIDEGDIGRFKGELRKAISLGSRGSCGRRYRSVQGGAAEGDIARFKGELREAISLGSRGSCGR